MSAVTRKPPNTWAPLVLVGLVLGAGLVFFFAAFPTGEGWAGRPYEWSPGRTAQALVAMFTGETVWTQEHTRAVLLWLVMPLAAAFVAWSIAKLTGPKKHEIDRAAKYMGHGEQIEVLRKPAVAKKAKRLGITGTKHPGVILAKLVLTGELLFASFEDTCVDIWGARAGKSSTRAIPAILTAPGSVLVTSNKPDLFQVCYQSRKRNGRVYLFDPQRICGDTGTPGVFFNPLSTVHRIEEAVELAKIFDDVTSPAEAKQDAFFGPTGQKLVADYLYAAALAGQYLDAVFRWLNNTDIQEPIEILKRHQEADIAARAEGTRTLTPKTRDIVFQEARRIVGFLESVSLREWLTPGEGREEFIPADFAASTTDTLFLLSQEGSGSAGPIIAALTKAVFNAAEKTAATTGTGRLPVPLLAVLDEAANICRIKDLPEKYSFYGSKGILPMVLLQSYEQGEEVWGQLGMAAMWSAANVCIYGGNARSPRFLSDLEKLIGTYEYKEAVISHGNQGKSTSYQTKTDSILSVSDLVAVPADRMIIIAGQSRPTLARTLPWYEDRALKRMVKEAESVSER